MFSRQASSTCIVCDGPCALSVIFSFTAQAFVVRVVLKAWYCACGEVMIWPERPPAQGFSAASYPCMSITAVLLGFTSFRYASNSNFWFCVPSMKSLS